MLSGIGWMRTREHAHVLNFCQSTFYHTNCALLLILTVAHVSQQRQAQDLLWQSVLAQISRVQSQLHTPRPYDQPSVQAPSLRTPFPAQLLCVLVSGIISKWQGGEARNRNTVATHVSTRVIRGGRRIKRAGEEKAAHGAKRKAAHCPASSTGMAIAWPYLAIFMFSHRVAIFFAFRGSFLWARHLPMCQVTQEHISGPFLVSAHTLLPSNCCCCCPTSLLLPCLPACTHVCNVCAFVLCIPSLYAFTHS